MLTNSPKNLNKQDLNFLANKLRSLCKKKSSNLALSADVTSASELLTLAEKIGPEIVILKTHIDIISDFSFELIFKLKELAYKHEFLIFEDRKFADIGNTVKHQFEGGLYKIAEWADIINVHTLPGPGVLEGILTTCLAKKCGVLLIAEMSSQGNLFSDAYIAETISLAKRYRNIVMGFISQKKLLANESFMYLTPGIQFNSKNDALGQGYITPYQAIAENQTDIIIVGRGILSADDPVTEAKKYKEEGWRLYGSTRS